MKTLIQNLFLALGLLVLPTVAQAQFTFTTNNGAITITGYNTAAGLNMVIPATTNGFPVTGIGYEAFFGSSITIATMPGNITNLGDLAFDNCPSLTNIAVNATNPAYSSLGGVLFDKAKATLIQFPAGLGGSYVITNSVTSIGADAFGHCTNLTSVTIPNSVTNIGESAFYVCTRLTSVTIPNSVINIADYGFYDCTSLTNVTLPDSVTNIGEDEFSQCTSLTNVTIPNSITSIGNSAFNSCTSLTSMTIPNSVTNIVDFAFAGCGLTSVAIPNSVTSIGVNVFEDCTSLTNVTIGNGVISIGIETFYGCTNLTNVTIGNGVTSIENSAFISCWSLTSVTIPNSVTNIEITAFIDCRSLKSAYFQGNAPTDGGFIFYDSPTTTVYYLSGTTGWGPTFSGVPTVLWNPQANTLSFTGGHFGFNLTGPTNAVIVVEACTNLSHAIWLPVATNTFSGSGTSTFSDLQSGAYPTRFYRERAP
jgi:BspA type Leucine rich repeat region (6 copies)